MTTHPMLTAADIRAAGHEAAVYGAPTAAGTEIVAIRVGGEEGRPARWDIRSIGDYREHDTAAIAARIADETGAAAYAFNAVADEGDDDADWTINCHGYVAPRFVRSDVPVAA